MMLDKGYSRIAKWDAETNSWFVGDVTQYRWLDSKDKPVTDWFCTIREAIDWLMTK